MEWVVPAVLVLLLAWGGLIRSRLRRLRLEATSAWPPLEALLRRRHGLVSPLIQALQTLPPKEQKPVQALLKARKGAALADLSPLAAGKAEMSLATAIENVRTLAGQHPELADEARFRQTLAALDALDEEIAAAQDSFNRAVYVYNLACVAVPAIIIAKYMNFWKIEYFGLDGDAREAVAEIERGHVQQRPEPML